MTSPLKQQALGMPAAGPAAPPFQYGLRDTPAVINFNSTAAQTIVAAITGQQIFVTRIYLVVGGATNLTFTDGTNTDGAIPLAANQGFVLDTQANGNPWFASALGSGFQITTSSAVQTSGRLYYVAQ